MSRDNMDKSTKGFIVDESGAVVLIMALALVAFLGMAALAIDYSYMSEVQGELKKAAEAGALAGAAALGSFSSPNWTAGTTAATSMVQQNSAAGDLLPAPTVTYGYWSTDPAVSPPLQSSTITPTSTDIPAIQVVVAKSVQLSFAPILGISTANLSGTAVAILRSTPGIWSILETGNGTVSISNNANVSGDVGVNGDGPFSLSNNATVRGKAYLKTGCPKSIGNGAVVQGGIQQDAGANAILQQATQAATTTYNTFSTLSRTSGTPGSINLSNNGRLTINGGSGRTVLVLTRLTLSNNAVLTLNAPASGEFVIRDSGTFSLGNSSRVDLTGGITEDKVTFVRTGTGMVSLSNNSLLNGNILSLNGAISLSNNAAVNGVLVSGGNITLSNNSVTTNKTPSGWGSFSSGGSGQSAALVQ